LNVKYSQIKYWPHLAKEFGIDKATYDAFSESDINSPTETMLNYIEVTEPSLTINEFCESLEKAEAHEVCRSVRESVKGKENQLSVKFT
jgi:hypothetical protein